MTTLYVKYRPSLISDRWLADLKDLEAELIKIMPDVQAYILTGFIQYKWYIIEHITGCFHDALEGNRVETELIVIPKNL